MQKKLAVLFANGKVKSLSVLGKVIESADMLVAVDGGYRLVKQLGKVPHVLIGDLDSISERNLKNARFHQTEIIRYPTSKNESDLELALTLAINRGYSKIIIIGGLGGRSDHTQVNLGLLLKSSPHVDIRFCDSQEEIFLVRGKAIIKGQSGDIISLVPFGVPVFGVKTNGLAYPLWGETLFPDQTRGLSNFLTSNLATISIESGNMLCFHIHKEVKK